MSDNERRVCTSSLVCARRFVSDVSGDGCGGYGSVGMSESMSGRRVSSASAFDVDAVGNGENSRGCVSVWSVRV